MKSFAILLVCYNRVDSLKLLLKSLEKVDFNGRNDIDLIFSIDYSGNYNVARLAESYFWKYGNKRVIKYEKNLGLKKHVLTCGNFTREYEILVVLEDDLIVSESLYYFANQCGDFYEDERSVAGISLYSFEHNWIDTLFPFFPAKGESDVFFMKIAQSWGQVWQHRKWCDFLTWIGKMSDNYETNASYPEPLNMWNPKSSWLRLHDIYCIECKKYFVYPYNSISTNFSTTSS